MIAIIVGTRQGECGVSKMLTDRDDVPVKEKHDVVWLKMAQTQFLQACCRSRTCGGTKS